MFKYTVHISANMSLFLVLYSFLNKNDARCIIQLSFKERKVELGQKPFQKFTNLKLGNLNIS